MSAASQMIVRLPELREVVLDFLVEPGGPGPLHTPDDDDIQPPDPEVRRALVALARTCRAFLEPSLDLLWRRMTSLEPLLWCFASRANVSAGKALHTPSLMQLDTIRRHARRIQQLEVTLGDLDASPTFLGFVIFEPNLFPNLTVLKWDQARSCDKNQIMYIQPLLGPRLATLKMTILWQDVSLASFLRTLPVRCPGLTTIGFDIQPSLLDYEWMNILSQSIRTFQNLKSITLDDAPVNEDTLRHLLTSSKLQELTINPWLNFDLSFLSPSDVPLRNLKKLCLTAVVLAPVIELLRPGEQTFDEVTLHLCGIEYATTVHYFFTALECPPHASALQELCLDGSPQLPSNDTSEALSLYTFQPLASHVRLQNLTIMLDNPISLSDDELQGLASNWPLLRVIWLCCDGWTDVHRLTLNGLLSLARVCPALQQVALTLDARDVPSNAPELKRGAITSLLFPQSPIADSPAVARFLLTHFPSVNSIDHLETCEKDGRDADESLAVYYQDREWAEVDRYLYNPGLLENEMDVES